MKQINKKRKCCICKDYFVGYGNNAEPVAKGLCCNFCNIEVIKVRIKLLKGGK